MVTPWGLAEALNIKSHHDPAQFPRRSRWLPSWMLALLRAVGRQVLCGCRGLSRARSLLSQTLRYRTLS